MKVEVPIWHSACEANFKLLGPTLLSLQEHPLYSTVQLPLPGTHIHVVLLTLPGFFCQGCYSWHCMQTPLGCSTAWWPLECGELLIWLEKDLRQQASAVKSTCTMEGQY
jgi:hypothetical protein